MLNTLKRRLLFINGCVVFVALLLATAASYWDSRTHLLAQTLRELDRTAQGEAQGIAAWIGMQQLVLTFALAVKAGGGLRVGSQRRRHDHHRRIAQAHPPDALGLRAAGGRRRR